LAYLLTATLLFRTSPSEAGLMKIKPGELLEQDVYLFFMRQMPSTLLKGYGLL